MKNQQVTNPMDKVQKAINSWNDADFEFINATKLSTEILCTMEKFADMGMFDNLSDEQVQRVLLHLNLCAKSGFNHAINQVQNIKF